MYIFIIINLFRIFYQYHNKTNLLTSNQIVMKMKILFLIVTIWAVPAILPAQQKYAVLITGDMAAKNIPREMQWNKGKDAPMQEFWNDTYLMWEMLLHKGYTNDNIIVLFGDGDDYYFNGMASRYISPDSLSPITDYAATRANVEMVFNGLANGINGFPKIQEDDFLFVWTFDHGAWDSVGHAWLCLMGNGNGFWDYEFAQMTNQIKCNKKVFFMAQCSSGGFIDDLENNTTIFFDSINYRISDKTSR